MGARSKKRKRRRGRPVTREMPEQIPDTPENVARAVLSTPPKRKWRYQQEHAAR